MPITKCLHCGETFEGGVVIVGRPTARLESLLHKLGSHMNTKHAEHAQIMGIYGTAFMGMLFLTNFKSDDVELNAERDKTRWTIHQQTLATRVTDDTLKEQSRELARTIFEMRGIPSDNATVVLDSFQEHILHAFTQLRDALEEPNKYELPKVGQLVTH
jgi:hypothetical protein